MTNRDGRDARPSRRVSDPGAADLPKASRARLDYLDGEISLGKAADLLGISRFELMERFQRLHIPLRLGPSTLAEAKTEVEAARLAR